MELPNLEKLDGFRKKGIRPGVVCCYVADKKALLVYKKEHELWQIPQGGVENGELLKDALKRETLEELGFESSGIFSLIGEATLEFPARTHGVKELKTDDGKDITMVGKHYYFCAMNVDPSIVIQKNTQFDIVKWFTFEEAKKIVSDTAPVKLPGKLRITLEILTSLQREKWIN